MIDLRGEGNRLFDLGDYDGAAQLFERLDPGCAGGSWRDFQLGRIAVRVGRWHDAITLLTQVLEYGDPPEPWAHFERSRAHRQLEPDDEAWIRDLACFVGYAVRGLTESDYDFIALAAHWAFEHDFLEDAFQLYRFLWFNDAGGCSCFVRYADFLVRYQNYDESITVLQLIEFDPDYDHWGDSIRGQAHQALGQTETARFYFTRAAIRSPTTKLYWQNIVAPPQPEMLPPEPINSHIEKLIEILSRHAERSIDGSRIESFYRLPATVIEEFLDGPLISTIEELTAASDAVSLNLLIDSFGGFEHASADVIVATLVGLRKIAGWDSLASALERCAGNLSLLSHLPFWSVRLEYLCHTRQYDQAQQLVACRHDLASLSLYDTLLIVVLYASAHRWDDIIDLFAARIALGESVLNPLMLETLCRATRNTNRYGPVLAMLAEARIDATQPVLQGTFDRLTEELQLRTRLEIEVPLTETPDMPQFVDRLQQERVDIVRRLLQPPAVQDGHTIFFCTDLNYLIGCCVGIYSLLHNNPIAVRRLDIRIYCTNEAIPLIESIIVDLNCAFSTAIRIFSAPSIIGQNQKFRKDYGLFTPGYGLTEAAYYRIFAARDILKESCDGRALYVDSDALLTWGVNELLNEFPMEGHPLAAAREIVTGEIREAAISIGVAPDTYFNSGVLLFDLAHPELPNRLDQAIDLAVNQPARLSFQDQCALNLAFHNHCAVLPQKFNYFVRERDVVPRFLQEPIIWHFLDRPKPWDSLYHTTNCGRWLRELEGFGALIGPERLKHLLLLQFPKNYD